MKATVCEVDEDVKKDSYDSTGAIDVVPASSRTRKKGDGAV